MTEQEWLACIDPRAMYEEMINRITPLSERRWRLLACAIQARYSDCMLPADDLAARLEVALVIKKATLWAETGKKPLTNVNSYYTLNELAYRGVGGLIEPSYVASDTQNVEMNQKFADLFREVIGNPFRPVSKFVRCEACNGRGGINHRLPVDMDTGTYTSINIYCDSCLGDGVINTWKRWLTPTVLSIAQQIYTTQDYAGMPILADAMEEAGCDVQSILEHLRGSNTHVRGCWVLDLILGKE